MSPKPSYPDNLFPDSDYHEEIASNVWVMDEHCWAYYAWEKFGFEHNDALPVPLVHIDKHWDADHYEWQYEEDMQQLRDIQSLDGVLKLYEEQKEKGREIRSDGFISPALVRKLTDEVHFYCLQNHWQRGFYLETLNQLEARQFLYSDIRDLRRSMEGRPLFFDFCLDLFNKSDMYLDGDLWSQHAIDSFLAECEPLVRQAVVVTISLSFGYSGMEDDTRNLARTVIPRFLEVR